MLCPVVCNEQSIDRVEALLPRSETRRLNSSDNTRSGNPRLPRVAIGSDTILYSHTVQPSRKTSPASMHFLTIVAPQSKQICNLGSYRVSARNDEEDEGDHDVSVPTKTKRLDSSDFRIISPSSSYHHHRGTLLSKTRRKKHKRVMVDQQTSVDEQTSTVIPFQINSIIMIVCVRTYIRRCRSYCSQISEFFTPPTTASPPFNTVSFVNSIPSLSNIHPQLFIHVMAPFTSFFRLLSNPNSCNTKVTETDGR